MTIHDLKEYKKVEVIHTTLVSEIILLNNPLTQDNLCLKVVIRNPPKPHSPMREIEILKLFKEYPHDNIIQYMQDWKDVENINIVFPYYRQDLKQIMLRYWQWYVPTTENTDVQRRSYLSGLFTLGMKSEDYKQDFKEISLERKHFLINKTPKKLMIKVWENLTSALKHLHKHDIMHRDLKPENVMYDEQRDMFVVIDFGISTGTRDNPNELLKPDGILDVGTYIYKPLEVLIGIKDYNCKVDMWSLMVIMHQLSVPFQCGYALKPHYYMGNEEDGVDEWIKRVCDKYNGSKERVHKKYDMNKKLQTIPALIDDGGYLIENKGKLELCEGSDIGLLSSIHDIFGCPLKRQFPMGEKSMAWVYMYNNNDEPEQVYYRSDERRINFLKSYMFGMIDDEYKEELLNMCEFDFNKRVLK
ncbi:uncharacterized protein HGUI_00106 [Hanseniaspora guilliermondii]|uniref:Protein kinase domain-containing protein n=1 Tax=Hanseniaspora guilliermondii TaxID=56406 RepID=A0A1L0ATM0_9ASCO|nr:uncharacterized protein HGUI_00106 [Hanseniaspora guilliermondii]